MFSGFALDLPQIELCSSEYVLLALYMKYGFSVLQELYSGLGAWNDTAASAQETKIFGKEYLPTHQVCKGIMGFVSVCLGNRSHDQRPLPEHSLLA